MRCEIYETNQKISITEQICVILKPTNFSNTPVEFKPGKYKIELWGGEGGGGYNATTGKGGYVSGLIKINETQTFYFYIGGRGYDGGLSLAQGGYNGGVRGGDDTLNNNCYSGGSGGATDMRISPGEYDDMNSLLSRIIVAGGGGSSGTYKNPGGGGHHGQ